MALTTAPFSAIITFVGDASVGLADLSFTAEIPDFREVFGPEEKELSASIRAETRERTAEFYRSMNDGGRPSVVFSDESDYEGGSEQEWGDDFERNIDAMPFEVNDDQDGI